MTNWAPATEAETAMRDALRSGDQELYFRILARTELLLPVSSDAMAGRAPMGWGTWTSGGRTHVLAFTSAESLQACLAEHAGSARRVPYHELAQSWPNLEWWLAVNPGLPIEGYLPAWFVGQLARGDVRLPGRTVDTRRLERVEQVESARTRTTAVVPAQAVPASEMVSAGPGLLMPPALPSAPPPSHTNGARAETAEPPAGPPFVAANNVEHNLLDAAEDGSTDAFLSTLLLARVLLPLPPGAKRDIRPGDPGFTWRTESVDDQMYVVVFTSPERLAEFFDDPVDAVEVKFVQLIKAWPGESWSFAVNPGSPPVGAKLPGAQIVALSSWAAEVGLGEEDATEEPSPAPAPPAPAKEGPKPTVMQKALPASKIDYYLTRGYDRVCGFVHRANEVHHLRTPAQLRAALGLGYSGSPFGGDDDVVYVLRWPAYRPSLYRIPYGGQTETAMRAMEGWMIQRGPFRGNGFAPSDSADVIAEFKVDSVRLPHGAQLWRVKADGSEDLIALLDADGPKWQQVGEP